MLPIAPDSVIDVLNVTRQDGHEHQSAADDAVVRLRAKGLHADALVAAGDAAEGILTLARGRDVDLIVMGTRGLTGIDRLRLGSVARNVLHHAHCSVLITHAGT